MLVTRRSFFSIAGSAVFGAAALALGGCGESRTAQSSVASASADAASASASAGSAAASASATASEPVVSASSDAAAAIGQSGALVVYFSRAGENYGVGVVEEGNTAIIDGVTDIIEKLPDGIYTVIGEKGTYLSGGEQ